MLDETYGPLVLFVTSPLKSFPLQYPWILLLLTFLLRLSPIPLSHRVLLQNLIAVYSFFIFNYKIFCECEGILADDGFRGLLFSLSCELVQFWFVTRAWMISTLAFQGMKPSIRSLEREKNCFQGVLFLISFLSIKIYLVHLSMYNPALISFFLFDL